MVLAETHSIVSTKSINNYFTWSILMFPTIYFVSGLYIHDCIWHCKTWK